jgi:hypothetical protein
VSGACRGSVKPSFASSSYNESIMPFLLRVVLDDDPVIVLSGSAAVKASHCLINNLTQISAMPHGSPTH